jgi:hypothetical protein
VARKGFVIHTAMGEWKQPISSFAEALYICRRYFNKVPHTGDTVIEINGKEIYRYVRTTEKEIIDMSVFSQYRDTLKANGQELDKEPKLDELNRLSVIRAHIPFTVTAAEVKEGKFGDQILYSIELHTTSPEFQNFTKTVSPLAAKYVLWTRATEGRVNQLPMLRPFIEQKTPLVMVGDGKDWDFDVKE